MRGWTSTALALLLLLVVGCVSGSTGIDDDAFRAEATAAMLLATNAGPDVSDDAAPDDSEPDDSQVGKRCDKCRGTGRSGDGIGPCGFCGGDGKIDRDDVLLGDEPSKPASEPSPKPEPPAVKSITIHLNNANYGGWPKEWWKTERLKLLAAGYTVQAERDFESEATDDAYFIVERGGKSFRLDGEKSALEIVTYEEADD